MPRGLPSPRYHQLYVHTNGEDDKEYNAKHDQAESLHGMVDEERVWGDMTVHDREMADRRLSRSQRVWSALTSIRSLLDTVLLLVILGLVLDRGSQKQSWFDVGGDITGFAPKMSQQIKSFVPDPTFIPTNGSEFFTETVQSKWLSIVPQGLGYVRINNTKDYNNLPTPLESYPDSTFTTSMTHQLHCLHAVVEVVAAYTSGELERVPEEGGWHLGHCFEYLRQSIMCCGDVALEGQHTTFPVGFTGSDGWDAKHVCRDYKQVLTHLEKNRVDDASWI